MHQENSDLLNALHECAMECDHCYDACLSETDVKNMVACIRLDRACAEICHLTMSFVASGSTVKNQLLRACADICDICAAECELHDNDHCQRCAEACRRCAEACRKG